MRKEQVLSRMREECLIAVIRAKNPEQGEKIVEAVYLCYGRKIPER